MTLTAIVAGVDLSRPGDQALARAVALATVHKARLILVHAQDDEGPIGVSDNELVAQLGEVAAALRVAEAGQLASRLARVKDGGVDATVVTREGPPAEILAALAAEEHAELIVVGTHGHSSISRFLLGSVAEATIRQAPCDVLVSRGPSGDGLFHHPLVATDFSPAADRALRHACRLSAADAPLDVVHAWQLPAGSWGAKLLGQDRFPWSTVHDAVLASVKVSADAFLAAHGSLGREFHLELVQGPAATSINHTAERGGHDLIALGTHGSRGFRRLLLGSVAEATIRHAPCSVLIAHAELAER
jgi:nucleotide-binding universal stress UspA family protein